MSNQNELEIFILHKSKWQKLKKCNSREGRDVEKVEYSSIADQSTSSIATMNFRVEVHRKLQIALPYEPATKLTSPHTLKQDPHITETCV